LKTKDMNRVAVERKNYGKKKKLATGGFGDDFAEKERLGV